MTRRGARRHCPLPRGRASSKIWPRDNIVVVPSSAAGEAQPSCGGSTPGPANRWEWPDLDGAVRSWNMRPTSPNRSTILCLIQVQEHRRRDPLHYRNHDGRTGLPLAGKPSKTCSSTCSVWQSAYVELFRMSNAPKKLPRSRESSCDCVTRRDEKPKPLRPPLPLYSRERVGVRAESASCALRQRPLTLSLSPEYRERDQRHLRAAPRGAYQDDGYHHVNHTKFLVPARSDRAGGFHLYTASAAPLPRRRTEAAILIWPRPTPRGMSSRANSVADGAGMGGLARAPRCWLPRTQENPALPAGRRRQRPVWRPEGYSAARWSWPLYEALGYDAINTFYRDFRWAGPRPLAL